MVIYIVLGAIIVLQSLLHHIERKDLYTRIMSRSLEEYKGTPTRILSYHRKRLNEWRKRGGND